ncbi:MAG TPA: hypothetical protein VGM25_08455 [Caulobacteraceae bacterium]|jgi:hypothetical protein
MDQGLEQRINKVLERRRQDHQEQVSLELQALRAAHDRVVSEIPGALARLSSAIAEINDAVDGSGIHLRLDPVDEPYTIEASFHVSLWPTEDRGLVFNVSHDGKLIALLSTRQSRVRLNSRDIWLADRPFFLDTLVSLLEAGA